MKNCKQGFTLAEVATALAIVGVISAMVIPLVTKNIQKQQSAAILGRAVEQIELGCQNMIQLANSRRTDGSYSDVLSTISTKDLGIDSDISSIVPGNFGKYAPPYLDLNPQTITSVKTVKDYAGVDATTDAKRITDGNKYSFAKFPAAVSLYNTGVTPSSTDTDVDSGVVVYIDTNGWSNYPNRTGKDIFAFKLLNGGTLVPATGTEAGTYAKRVVDDGFKIKY